MNDPVLDLIQKQGLQYQTSGRDYVIKCINPEHPDTNPSLRIDKVTGSFHCFACHFKGNIFKHFGILTNQTPMRVAKLKEKLQELKTNNNLEMPSGATPWTKAFRGISAKTLKHFNAFYTNYEEKLRDRICFPIQDITDRTVVFLARHTLSNGNPRYVNYPSGVSMPIFPPSAPPEAKSVVLVEGLFDFLNLYDKGLTNVSCCFGTNTLHKDTKQKLLPFRAQGVQNIYIMFDGDQAGETAAHQLKPLIEQEGFVVEIIHLPDGTDPGDLDLEAVESICKYVKK